MDNMMEEYTPRQRLQRRPVSNSTRRRSTLLYLEKYGLDQPNWHTSVDEPELCDNFRPNTQTIIVKRPTSIRNSIKPSTAEKRPSYFIKPDKSSLSTVSVPTEFKKVHQFLDKYNSKLYIEGYLSKRNDLNSDGSTHVESKHWRLHYVELSGAVLTLWDAEQHQGSDNEVIPRYINITDATVVTESSTVFSLNSAGANRFVFQTQDPESLKEWILAIRLSCFECARIQEIYTFKLITRPHFTHHHQQQQRLIKSGFVQVRFPGTTGWKQYWAVVTNHKVEKRLFFSKKFVPTDGKMIFYESRKSKYPIMTFNQVAQAYTVYPESPKLISLATLFKMEGHAMLYNDNKVNASSSSALIMASDTNDMVHWLTSIYDAFQLYGRPEKLKDDPRHPSALNFGDLSHPHQHLMLNMHDVCHVDINNHDLIATKQAFTHILQERISQDMSASSLSASSASSITTTTTSASLATEADKYRATTQRSKLRSVTLASDSEDDESLYQFGTKPSAAVPSSDRPLMTDMDMYYEVNKQKQQQHQKQRWDTASVPPLATTNNEDSYFVQQQNAMLSQDRAKLLEHRARASKKPFLKQLPVKNRAPRGGLVGSIDDERRRSSVYDYKTRSMIEHQQYMMTMMMMQQQQQFMQQQGMMMMDPRMITPVMSPQPMMMYDPRMSMPILPYLQPTTAMPSPNRPSSSRQNTNAFRKSAMMTSSSSSNSSNSLYSASSAKVNNRHSMNE